MIVSIQNWLSKHDYNFYECNYVPPKFFVSNKKINVLLRTLFRLNPFKVNYSDRNIPFTPQATVAMLKAAGVSKDSAMLRSVFPRIYEIKSPLTKHFALKQGIQISVALYENSADDPTPLNTAWLGEFLLDNDDYLGYEETKQLLESIIRYFTDELGYQDFGDEGIYFYYGPTLKKIVYNASAIISALLIRCGKKYSNQNWISLGCRGIKFILNHQNEDGSWFYAAHPSRPTIDNFHQLYILRALQLSKEFVSGCDEAILKGENYYKKLLFDSNGNICPKRYDKNFMPRNTWLFVKYDSRDLAEAILYFSEFQKNMKLAEGLVEFVYRNLYDKKNGTICPEKFIYGNNRNPYIEFQGWMLYALNIFKKNYQ